MDDRTKAVGGIVAGVGSVAAAAVVAGRRRRRGAGEEASDGAAFLEHLAEAVRIRTVSYEDRSRIETDEFDRFAAFLQATYPLVHERLRREVVAGHALLYTWVGADPTAPAVVLMAHQDVVPVEAGTSEAWERAPFSGEIADGYLWGRGAADDKGALIGILESVESLLAEGFEPQVTLLLVFGDDEEIGGSEGAAAIAGLLEERAVPIDFVLDEGGAVGEDLLPGAKAPVALVGVGEKGYVNLSLTATGDGGHSSAPPSSTAIGRVAEAIRRIEASPMPARLGVQRPLLRALGRVMPLAQRLVLRRPGWFSALLERRLSERPTSNALIRTTMAPTMVRGGVKVNVLPQEATAVVNVRIMPGDTIEDVVAHAAAAVGEVAEVGVLDEGFRSDPPPLSPADSVGYRMIAETAAEVFGVADAPWILTGATDSRHFVRLAEGGVYRFSPFTFTPDDLGRIHGTGERIRVADAPRALAFYEGLIRRACGV